MVVNGATKFGDMEHFKTQLAAFTAKGGDVSMEYLHEQNLIALQGAYALCRIYMVGYSCSDTVL